MGAVPKGRAVSIRGTVSVRGNTVFNIIVLFCSCCDLVLSCSQIDCSILCHFLVYTAEKMHLLSIVVIPSG